MSVSWPVATNSASLKISNWPVGDIGTVNKQNMSLQA